MVSSRLVKKEKETIENVDILFICVVSHVFFSSSYRTDFCFFK